MKTISLSVALLIWTTLPNAYAGDQLIELNFKPEVNGKAFKCGDEYSSVGKTKKSMVPTDFRMYISEIEVENSVNGQWVKANIIPDNVWQSTDVVMLDFEDGSGPCRNGTTQTNSKAKFKTTVQNYQGVRFKVGVPFISNHGNPTLAPSPLSTTALFWNWQIGYRFIKFDARTKPDVADKELHPNTQKTHQAHPIQNTASGYSFHLGSTQCASTSTTTSPKDCKNPNRVVVELKPFNIDKNTIIIDIGKVLQETDISYNTPNTSPGCMSFPNDPDCVEVMNALGLPYDNKTTNTKQRFITVR